MELYEYLWQDFNIYANGPHNIKEEWQERFKNWEKRFRIAATLNNKGLYSPKEWENEIIKFWREYKILKKHGIKKESTN